MKLSVMKGWRTQADEEWHAVLEGACVLASGSLRRLISLRPLRIRFLLEHSDGVGRHRRTALCKEFDMVAWSFGWHNQKQCNICRTISRRGQESLINPTYARRIHETPSIPGTLPLASSCLANHKNHPLLPCSCPRVDKAMTACNLHPKCLGV